MNRTSVSHSAVLITVEAAILVGCSQRPARSAELPLADTPVATSPVAPAPTETATASPPSATAVPTPDAYPGWATYVQEDYGLTLRYPVAWGLTALPAGREVAGGAGPAEIRLMRDDLRLTIQVKAGDEPYVMGPSGTGAGDLIERGSVTFLNYELPQEVLVYEDKDKAVYAGGEIDGLVFHIQLDEVTEPGADYGATAIPAEAQAEMLAILASCTLDGAQATTGSGAAGQTAAIEAGSTSVREADGMTMVYVPAGRFEMGSSDDDVAAYMALCEAYGSYDGKCPAAVYDAEQPAHPVTVDAYWIDRTEVTVAQYQVCADAGVCDPTSLVMERWGPIEVEPDYPATTVFWSQAAAYCEYVGGRLPTEAEWEYAARGPEDLRFPWGDDFEPGNLNYCDAACDELFDDEMKYGRSPGDPDHDDGYATMAPVGSYPDGASWCGALDMAGNVSEWTADWIGFYTVEEQDNPTGPQGEGENKVIKGRSWLDFPVALRSSGRISHYPESGSATTGFRCVVPVQ